MMWLSFGIRPAKNEHKRLLILKIQSPLVTAFGLSFFLSPKVGNSFQTAKHHSKNLDNGTKTNPFLLHDRYTPS
ncbi:hypothetical protein GAC73_27120 [Bacteroides thetaiotaomicron]|nr:hypothetical protein GAC73_30580 [Bacteroides thetaiotaomicron]KAB5162359.1 hypothetical protein GAC73_30210 [Bacteroides thetaiotaomicron]KAB5165447.1 hypothetical protein GAC73_27120 [Bacteroides thetaiotaomicron]